MRGNGRSSLAGFDGGGSFVSPALSAARCSPLSFDSFKFLAADSPDSPLSLSFDDLSPLNGFSLKLLKLI